MRAVIKRCHSPDIDLDSFIPVDNKNFGFLLQVMAGPEGGIGEESFDMMVCTPEWFSENNSNQLAVWGRHYLFIFDYDIKEILQFISRYVEKCTGDTWEEVALKLGRMGHWEFEDYQKC